MISISANAADGFSFARSDSIHFTQDPSEAKTILYVTSQVFGEYPFFPLSCIRDVCSFTRWLGMLAFIWAGAVIVVC